MERGRELRNDYKLIARALTRKGNALVKMGRLEEAVGVYQKSLTEHRCVWWGSTSVSSGGAPVCVIGLGWGGGSSQDVLLFGGLICEGDSAFYAIVCQGAWRVKRGSFLADSV